ncbi:malectin domain-containing carbohydrate-binding protein [Methylorubrum rhodesianum]|uniref:malectin domain-containing carbohydrate-binding protein n=1 Tax=Methylorubrum rhodesianum TaxID=29427 RepID=UPI003D065640
MADVTFSQSTLAGYSGLASALQWGPDGRLYVAERFGSIKALTVAQNGNGYVVTKTESIDLILNLPNHNDDGTLNASLKERQVTGILATGTAANPVLYVTSSDPRIGAGNGGEDTNLDTNSSIISRLTFDSASQSWKKVDLVRGLPRSEENHSANGMAISPDGKTLYVAVGGNTNAGAPSNNFAGLPEFAYSAAVLKVDLTALDAMSIKDPNGLNPYVYDLPTLDDPNRPNNGTPGNENPDGSDVSGPFGGRDGLNMAKITAGSPVQVYSPGYRNAYDVLLTSDGKMFTYDNGANNGWGGRPSDASGNVVTNQNQIPLNTPDLDGGTKRLNYDQLHEITGQGYYGGHPNLVRAVGGQAGWLLTPGTGVTGATFLPQGSAGLPADFNSVIPAGTADPRQSVFFEGGISDGALDTGQGSLNGLAEYTASTTWTTANGGTTSIKGAILVTDLAGYLHIIPRNASGGVDTTVGAAGQIVAAGKQVVPMGGGAPLGIDAVGDGKPFAGTVWVTTLADGNIRVLTPGPTNPQNLDLDGDGINNTLDPFALDPDNGTAGTDVISGGKTIVFNFESGAIPGTFGGSGLTGAMINGLDPFLDGGLYTSSNIIAGGAGGVIQLKNVQEGDFTEGNNTLKDALQAGVTFDDTVATANVTMTMANWIPNATSDGGFPSAGLQIGTGDQDNFIKLVLGGRGESAGGKYTSAIFETSMENLGVAQTASVTNNALLSATNASWVQLRLAVNLETNTVTPYWRFGTGAVSSATDANSAFTAGASMSVPSGSALLKAIQGDYTVGGKASGMAVGLMATSNDGAPFTADFDGITITTTAKSGTTNPVVAAINAGGGALTQDGIGFSADQYFTGGATFIDGTGGNGLQSAFTNTVYQTERYGNFSYAIPVASTTQAYTVELRFGELWWSNPGQRVFDVSLEGQTVLNDLDIVAQTGSFNTPYTYVSGPITAGANGTLDLQFLNGIDNAKLSGIVVRQANGGGGTDATKPTVGPFTVQAPVAGDASASVTVVYNDASGINLASITAADIAVSGPGAVGAITLQSKTSTSATSATATYIVAAPTSGWTNGQYTATVKAGEVADASPAANTNLAASQLFSVQTSSAGGIVAAINAGGGALIQDGIGFSADQYFTGGATFIDGTGGNGLQSAFTNTVYQTERYGNFSYAIPVASTTQAYTVELRFGELWWSNPGQRVFDVSLEGQTVLNDLDIVAQTGSFNTPYTYVSGPITAGANGTLDLQFLNGIDNAKLSGIVVRQATGSTDTTGPSIGSFTVAGPASGTGNASVTVVYNDASGINLNSIAAADLAVTGAGAVGAISLQSKVATSATSATATYLVAAPNGGWADGSYTATVKAGEVADASPAANTNAAASHAFTIDVTPGGDTLVLAINSGGSAFTRADGTLFEADTAAAPHRYYVAGQDGNATFSDVDPIAGTTDDALYQNQRFGWASASTTDADDGRFGYAVKNADGSALASGSYKVVLHFAEIYNQPDDPGGLSGAGQRQFNIGIEGTTVANYDIWAAAAGGATATTLTRTVSVTDGTLNLAFWQGTTENPTVAAVEVWKIDPGSAQGGLLV